MNNTHLYCETAAEHGHSQHVPAFEERGGKCLILSRCVLFANTRECYGTLRCKRAGQFAVLLFALVTSLSWLSLLAVFLRFLFFSLFIAFTHTARCPAKYRARGTASPNFLLSTQPHICACLWGLQRDVCIWAPVRRDEGVSRRVHRRVLDD